MVTLRIAKWPGTGGLVHKSTSWEVSTDKEFNNILDSSPEDEVFLDIYYSGVVVPKDSKYYGRAKRHFEDGASTEWVGPIVILPSEAGDTVEIKPEVTVDTPYVSMDKIGIIDPETTEFTIKTGSFRCKNDGHLATSWILKNGVGRVLYVNMYDKVNKKELTIQKSEIDLENVNTLILEANHITSNGYESNFGKATLPLNRFKFEIVSNIHSVSPFKDYTFEFAIHSGIFDDVYGITAVVRNAEEEVLMTNKFDNQVTSFVIPRLLITEKSTLFIDMYQDDQPNSFKRVVITTTAESDIYRTDDMFQYFEGYKETKMLMPKDLRQASSEQFLDNGIPLPRTDDNITGLYNFDRRLNTFTLSGLPVTFMKKIDDGKGGANYKVLNKNRILIDSTTGTDDVPEFRVFIYDKQLLVGQVDRTDEEHSTSITNNLTINSDGTYGYYFAKVNGAIVMRRLDTDTMEIKDMTPRPDAVNLDINLVYIGNGRLMSFNGGSKPYAYIYSIAANEWERVTKVPDKFFGLVMSSYLRKDGKVISFNTGFDTNDILLFEPEHNEFRVLINDLDDTIVLDTTVRLRDGKFLRYNSDGADHTSYIYG